MAVAVLQEQRDFEHRVVLLGSPERLPELIPASHSRLVAVKDGYRLTASAPGWAMVVLPVQFSHCWKIESSDTVHPPRTIRARYRPGLGFSSRTTRPSGCASILNHGERRAAFKMAAICRNSTSSRRGHSGGCEQSEPLTSAAAARNALIVRSMPQCVWRAQSSPSRENRRNTANVPSSPT